MLSKMAYSITKSKLYIGLNKYYPNTNLFLIKANIDKIIDILRNLLANLELTKVIQTNIIMLKRDWLIICNITIVIY